MYCSSRCSLACLPRRWPAPWPSAPAAHATSRDVIGLRCYYTPIDTDMVIVGDDLSGCHLYSSDDGWWGHATCSSTFLDIQLWHNPTCSDAPAWAAIAATVVGNATNPLPQGRWCIRDWQLLGEKSDVYLEVECAAAALLPSLALRAAATLAAIAASRESLF